MPNPATVTTRNKLVPSLIGVSGRRVALILLQGKLASPLEALMNFFEITIINDHLVEASFEQIEHKQINQHFPDKVNTKLIL